jgi:hypothetical protein
MQLIWSISSPTPKDRLLTLYNSVSSMDLGQMFVIFSRPAMLQIGVRIVYVGCERVYSRPHDGFKQVEPNRGILITLMNRASLSHCPQAMKLSINVATLSGR